MPRRSKSVVRKAGSAIARTARKLTAKVTPRKRTAAKVAAAPKKTASTVKPSKSRPVTRQSDVALDVIAAAYTPKQTSLKASFRSDGADQQLDQEMPLGAGEPWNDEDHFTNKSGDARIGTHGRSYEAGGKRAPSGNNNRR
jgi:hypothetical protein